jgi:sarcosine oxidase, subunit alpha
LLLRIKKHPILEFTWNKPISFQFNNNSYTGYPSDSIASALHANHITTFSTSIRYKRPRGFFCGIGKCSSCLMQVNGVPNVRTCIAPLTSDVDVKTQQQYAPWPTATKEYADKKQSLSVDLLVIGAGPAGMEASIQAAKQGATVLLVDENQNLGGQLIKQTHKFFGSKQEKAGTRGITIAKELKQKIETLSNDEKIIIMPDATAFGFYEGTTQHRFTFGVMKRKKYHSQLYEINCKAAVVSVGAMENMLLFPGNDLPGVYGAGAVQTLMNVYGVKPGNEMIMVGAGNVGLIVSYQLLQAGIKVACLVEAAPYIGGYHVHAAKLRRCGVPIYTSRSIKEVLGSSHVEGAILVDLDEQWQPVKGTEQTISCDTVCLAVGLTPSTRLLGQIGVAMKTIPEAGGFIALHDQTMQTSIPGIFVAGDASGIEEASTAMIEGKIAGLKAANSIGYKTQDANHLFTTFQDELKRLRAGPFGEKPRLAKEKIESLWGKEND